MMAIEVPTPLEDPKTWETLIIAGVKMPGVIQRVRLGAKLLMTREGIPGKNGAIYPDPRWSEETMEFEMLISSAEDLQAVQRLRQAYKNPGTGDKVVPVLVEHPLLRLWQISSMVVEGVELDWTNQVKNFIRYTIKLTNNRPKLEKGKTVAAPGSETLADTAKRLGVPVSRLNPDGSIKPLTSATVPSTGDSKATNTPPKPSQGPKR